MGEEAEEAVSGKQCGDEGIKRDLGRSSMEKNTESSGTGGGGRR